MCVCITHTHTTLSLSLSLSNSPLDLTLHLFVAVTDGADLGVVALGQHADEHLLVGSQLPCQCRDVLGREGVDMFE